MSAQVLPFPTTPRAVADAFAPPQPRALTGMEAALYANLRCDVEVLLSVNIIPMLEKSAQALAVMRTSLRDLRPGCPVAVALSTEAELLADMIDGLRRTTTDPFAPPPTGAA